MLGGDTRRKDWKKNSVYVSRCFYQMNLLSKKSIKVSFKGMFTKLYLSNDFWNENWCSVCVIRKKEQFTVFLLAFYSCHVFIGMPLLVRKEEKNMYALHFVGWEEWIKGETHSGKDIIVGKVSLLNWSILSMTSMCVYVAVCLCLHSVGWSRV